MYPTRTTFATGTFAVPPRVSRPGRWQEVGTLPPSPQPSPAPRPGRWVDAVPAPAPEPDSAALSPAAVSAAADAPPAAPVPGPAPEPDSAALSPVAVSAAADAPPAAPVPAPAPEPDSAVLSPVAGAGVPAWSAAPETRCEVPAPWAETRGGHPALETGADPAPPRAAEGSPGYPASVAEAAPGRWAESAARDARVEARPPAAAPDPWTEAAVPLPAAEARGAHPAPVSAPGARGEIPAPAAAPESGPGPWTEAAAPSRAAEPAPVADAARLAAVGGPEVRSEHPDPVEAAEPGPAGSWTPAGQAPASQPGHWAEVGTMRPTANTPAPHPAQPAEVRGEVPAPTVAPESGTGSWTETAAPRPARLAAVGGPEAEHGSAGWGAAGAQPDAVGGSEVRGEHPVAEAEPGHGRWEPAAESGSGRRPDARTEADVPEARGEHPEPVAEPGHGRGAEVVGVRPAAEAQASRPGQLAAVGGPEAEPGHGRWAEEAPPASHPGQLAQVGGPEPLGEVGPCHWPEPAAPAPVADVQAETAVPDGRAEAPAPVSEVRAVADSERWAEAVVPNGRAGVPVPGAEVGLSDVRAEDGSSRAEDGVPDGRAAVPAPGVELGVSEVRAEVDSERWAEAAVRDGRADVPAPGVEAGLSEVRAEDGSSRWAEVGVPDDRADVRADVRAEADSQRWAEAAVPGGRAAVPAPAAEVRAGAFASGAEAGVSEGSGEASVVGEGRAVAAVGVPHTRDGDEAGRGDVPAARVDAPRPGVVDLVARAVARGIRDPEVADGRDGSRLRSGRGSGVAEVPVRLPFRAQPQPRPPVAPRPAAPARPRAGAGRRVPRGDDRLREHRGPVLPGWVAVLVGALALTGCAAVLWRAGVVPAVVVAAFGATPRAYQGLRVTHWPPLAFLGVVALVALGGLGRARAGHAWVLTLFGRYRGTVRRTGLTWVSPLLLRRRVDVRLRHWRSDPMPAVDAGGLALRAVVQVVWQVKDTARATLAVEDHTEYLAEQVESAMARVLSRLPADAFHEDAPTLRDAEAVGDALTRMLAAETEAVGIEVYSAQPTRIEYAPEVAEAMRRRRVAAIDAKHRDAVLTSVVDAVDDTVHRLTSRGLVELDDYERKALVKDLTVAFYTGRPE
ncbi:SPFH domain-containing protein [Streptomyces goshikiensis]|uniref:SPFH domain-containing protein n=2 Tax=Streptomyces TaxID=1883 RepID=UPI003713EE8C